MMEAARIKLCEQLVDKAAEPDMPAALASLLTEAEACITLLSDAQQEAVRNARRELERSFKDWLERRGMPPKHVADAIEHWQIDCGNAA